MPKVLINCLLLTKKLSGVEVYIENLILELDNIQSPLEIHVLISNSYKGELTQFKRIKIVKLPISTKNRFIRIFVENLFIPYYILKNKISLLHSPAYILPFFTPCKTIVTVHDLIALNFPSLCQNSTAIYFNLLLPFSIRKADKIIAVSNTTKKDIIEFNSFSEGKTQTTYLGVEKRFFNLKSLKNSNEVKIKYNLPEKYILFVGNIEPKKNLTNLIKAYILFKQNEKNDIKLVIAGRLAWKYDETLNTINSSQFKSSIHLIGYVDEEDLPYLYYNAELFTFVSIYEGFGIPALEAMACGIPLLVSNAGALPEITNSIYPLVDPYNILEISKEIHKMTKWKQDENTKIKAINWSRNFTWVKMANETIEIYHNILQ